MLLHQLFEESARRMLSGVALIDGSRTVEYGALDRLANRFANVLRGAGMRGGARVIISLENRVELVAAYLGTLKAGGVAVPLPAGPRSDRLEHAVRDCTPAACITDGKTATAMSGFEGARGAALLVMRDRRAGPSGELPAHAQVLEAAVDAASDAPPATTATPDDLAAIIYTSGSTGAPRGVMLSHRNLVANTRSIVSYLHLTAADRVMCVLPFYYVYGLSLLHTHLAVGGSVVIDNRFVFPNVVLNAMVEHRVTGFAGVPSTFALLLQRSAISEMTFPQLRYVTQAGGAMAPGLIREWLDRGPQVDFYVMYGATEASARLAYLEPGHLRRKLGSIGRAIPDVDIEVIKDGGEIAAPGEMGELVARGDNIALGYWNNPEETSSRFGPLGYRTGDVGYKDEEGFLFLAGRRHDLIKVGAHRVGAIEIENVLHEHPWVAEAAVIGTPDEILGEKPIAFVAVRERAEAAPDALRLFCAQRVPPHKVPASVVVLPELPKLAGVGKIDKSALRAMAAAPVATEFTPHGLGATTLGSA